MRRTGAAGSALLVLLALAACAPQPSTPDATAPLAPAAPRRSASAAAPAGHADCTRATKVAIDDNGGEYSFSPRALTIRRGAFIAVTNRSDQAHELVAKPDAGLVTSVVDPRERQVIQFTEAGRFTVQSADPDHRAVLRVTVAGESGCGVPRPTLTMTDGDTFSPARLTVVATANFTVVNKSDSPQSVICSPGGNGDHSRLEAGETQILALDEPGRYTCSSTQHPEAKATINVRAD